MIVTVLPLGLQQDSRVHARPEEEPSNARGTHTHKNTHTCCSRHTHTSSCRTRPASHSEQPSHLFSRLDRQADHACVCAGCCMVLPTTNQSPHSAVWTLLSDHSSRLLSPSVSLSPFDYCFPTQLNRFQTHTIPGGSHTEQKGAQASALSPNLA